MPNYEDRLHRIPSPHLGNKTHYMSAEVDDKGDWYAFPNVQQDSDGMLRERETRSAMAKALRTGDNKYFGKDKAGAIRYSKDYKIGTVIDDEREKQRRIAEILRGEYL